MSFTSKWNLITFAPAYPPRPPSSLFLAIALPPPFRFAPFALLALSSFKFSLFSSPPSPLYRASSPPCFSISFDHTFPLVWYSFPPPPLPLGSRSCSPTRIVREVFALERKYLNFRSLVQRKLLLSPPLSCDAATQRAQPLSVRYSGSYPRPNYIARSRPPCRAVYSTSGYSNAVAIISFRLSSVVHHPWSSRRVEISFYLSLFLFFFFIFLVMLGRGNCLFSFEIAAIPPFCCLIS